MDKLISYCEVVYQDANGDGIADLGDVYGVALTAGNDSGTHDGFTGACGVEMVKKNAEGVPELVIGNEITFTYCDTMKRLLFGSNNVWNTTVDSEPSTKFMNNTALFYPTFLSATETLRDMESDYGIIPLPKLNDAQADYTGFTHNGFSVFALPVTCDNTDLCGAFLELMCVESYRSVTPAYYEVALKNKYARDNVVSQMLDQITQNIHFDFGYVYSASLGDLIKTFRKLNSNEASNPASSLRGTAKVTEKLLQNLVKQIEELEA